VKNKGFFILFYFYFFKICYLFLRGIWNCLQCIAIYLSSPLSTRSTPKSTCFDRFNFWYV